MESLLEQLYWGNLQPNDIPLKSKQQLREEAKRHLELSDKFCSLLSQAAMEAYDEMSAFQNETEADLEALRFASGFKLGALFMMEIFT